MLKRLPKLVGLYPSYKSPTRFRTLPKPLTHAKYSITQSETCIRKRRNYSNVTSDSDAHDNWEWIPPRNRLRVSMDEKVTEAELDRKEEEEEYLEIDIDEILKQDENMENVPVGVGDENVTIEQVAAMLHAQGHIPPVADTDDQYNENEFLDLEDEKTDGKHISDTLVQSLTENLNEEISSSEFLNLSDCDDYDDEGHIVPLTMGKHLSKDEIVKILEVNSAMEVKAYDLTHKGMMGDFIILASAKSRRHVKKLEREVKYYHKKRGVKIVQSIPPRRGTFASDDWIAIDTGYILINVFIEEVREELELDDYWRQVSEESD